MGQSNKKKSTEDIMESLMAELKLVDNNDDSSVEKTTISPSDSDEVSSLGEESDFGLLDLNFGEPAAQPQPEADTLEQGFEIKIVDATSIQAVPDAPAEEEPPTLSPTELNEILNGDKTVALTIAKDENEIEGLQDSENDRTVAVAGYSNRNHQNNDNEIKISVGQSGGSTGYGNWGSTDSHLAQAENLKMAQAKILELEKENEKFRQQNEELIAASEIIKERSDLLTAQVYEYKNDREGLENSFKSEISLIKSQLNRKDAELQKAHMKIEELDSRLRFDMKKIRIRERELENRLELIRAEKNALVRNKDEQILEARRKIDQLQLEVDSFRQKCVELNRALETNQDSFKRTTRALRLAMANLELQEENKTPFKKVD